MLPLDISIDDTTTRADFDEKNMVSLCAFLAALTKAISFKSALSVDCFEYLDDEGDNVLVRSDEEFQTFVHAVLEHFRKYEDKVVAIRPVLTRSDAAAAPLKLTLDNSMDTDSVENIENDVCRSKRVLPQTDAVSNSLSKLRNILSEDVHPVSFLGSGHSGSVYKALDVRNDRFVAVKSIALDVSVEVKEQVLSEMDILYKCSSPFVIDFYGACFTDNLISIYTEFMDGGSMDQVVRRLGQLEEPVLCSLAVAIVNGLVYLWEMKIMHRDVKPSNILVNSQGDVKLCDFGVSVQPERLLGQDYTIRSDVWSLGLSLLEMAMGHFPYGTAASGSMPPMAIIETIVDSDPPSLDINEYSSALCDFIGLCLQKDPQKRPTFHQLKNHQLITSNEPFKRDVIANLVSRAAAT